MMDNDIRPDAPKDPYFLPNQQVDQQWSKDKTEEPVLNKPTSTTATTGPR